MIKFRSLFKCLALSLFLSTACSKEGGGETKNASSAPADSVAEEKAGDDAVGAEKAKDDSSSDPVAAEDVMSEDEVKDEMGTGDTAQNDTQDEMGTGDTAQNDTQDEMDMGDTEQKEGETNDDGMTSDSEVTETPVEKGFCGNREKFLDMGGLLKHNGTDVLKISYLKRLGIDSTINIYHLNHPDNNQLPAEVNDLNTLKESLKKPLMTFKNDSLEDKCGVLELSELDLVKGKYVVVIEDVIQINDYAEFTVERENICNIDSLKGKTEPGINILTPNIPYKDESGKDSYELKIQFFGLGDAPYKIKYDRSSADAVGTFIADVSEGYACGEVSREVYSHSSSLEGDLFGIIVDSKEEVVTSKKFVYTYKPPSCKIEGLKQYTTPFLEVIDSPDEPERKIWRAAGLDGKSKNITAYAINEPFDVNSGMSLRELGIKYKRIYGSGTTNQSCAESFFDVSDFPSGHILFELITNSDYSIDKRVIFSHKNNWQCEDDVLKTKINSYFDVPKFKFGEAEGDTHVVFEYSKLNLDIFKKYYILIVDADRDTLIRSYENDQMALGYPCGKNQEGPRIENVANGNYKFVLSTDRFSMEPADVVIESSEFTVERTLKCEIEELKGIMNPTISFDKAEYKVGEKPILKAAGFPGGSVFRGFGLSVYVESVENGGYKSHISMTDYDSSCHQVTVDKEFPAGEYTAKIVYYKSWPYVSPEGAETVEFKVVE